LIASRFAVSAELVILAMLLALALALPAAVLSSRRPYGVIDWVTRSASMLGLSVPGFVVALFLILFFSVKIHWFPVSGFAPLDKGIVSNLHTMALPTVTLAAVLFGSYTRILRGDMVDQLSSEDYVLTARSKGLPERSVLMKHVFRNSAFSLVTVVGAQLGTLLGGGAIIESIFGLPGVGQLLLNSIYDRDLPVIEGIIVVVATVVVIMNLITDLSYMVIDPRVKYGAADH
jgi:peptide/nickel transport system permease protein